MPKPRRRTLSHSEIENFLTEISQVSGENHVNKQAKQANDGGYVTKHQRHDVEDHAETFMEEEPAVPPQTPPTDVDLIREYCKMKFRPAECMSLATPGNTLHDRTVEISKVLHDHCKYKLISSRLMFPEQYPHPSTSIESKKSLLISLSPMLTEAEDQRKQDTKECEEFTRCRSSRGKGRSNYEYIDLDLSIRVEFAEFERRYMLFINRNKAPKVDEVVEEDIEEFVPLEELIEEEQVEVVTVEEIQEVSVVNIPELSLATQSIAVDPVIMDDEMTEEVPLDLSFERKRHGERKRKHNSVVDRRGTLSPASAKAMLLNAVEEEAAAELAEKRIQTPPISPVKTKHSPMSLAVNMTENASVEMPMIEENDDVLAMSDDLFGTNKSFKHSHHGHRYAQRRNTLSPSSAKCLALELIEKEEEEAAQAAVAQAMAESIQSAAMESKVMVMEEEDQIASSEVESESDSDLLAFQDDTDDETSSTSPESEPLEAQMDMEEKEMERNQNLPINVVENTVVVESVSHEIVTEVEEVPVSQLDEILCNSSEGSQDSGSSECEDSTVTVSGIESPRVAVIENIHNMISTQDDHNSESIHTIDSAALSDGCSDPIPSVTMSDITTDFDELIDENIVTEAVLPSSPNTAFSAFFGRKSEIAEILKIAMNIFEEDEHELKIFEKIESLVTESTSGKSNIGSDKMSGQSSIVTQLFKPDDIPKEFDVAAMEISANKRMKELIVIARNKYLWEVVSVHAANAAIRKMKSKTQSQQ